MSELTISERAEALAARLEGGAAASFRLPEQVPASQHPVIELARLLAEHARAGEQRDAAVLAKHQGPYFNGVDMRCGCQQIVADGLDWARHVARVVTGADR
ncbi:hypothetical protein [Mycolicibacterium fortuitum]|uniref:hypothetical protein n=1 Tax=Mycolicibacterium fortuitum TaxID=1766 RepID=UPI001AEFF439|nr:hypothetical protein [Mycolicibacterium fortuitum]MBP3087004.1 hypothetical protein [Mycolicibacterium fortuitum]